MIVTLNCTVEICPESGNIYINHPDGYSMVRIGGFQRKLNVIENSAKTYEKYQVDIFVENPWISVSPLDMKNRFFN